MKHIVDHPRTRTSERLSRYGKLDLETRSTPSAEVSVMLRQPRTRRDSERLKPFTALDRREG